MRLLLSLACCGNEDGGSSEPLIPKVSKPLGNHNSFAKIALTEFCGSLFGRHEAEAVLHMISRRCRENERQPQLNRAALRNEQRHQHQGWRERYLQIGDGTIKIPLLTPSRIRRAIEGRIIQPSRRQRPPP